MKKKGRKLTHLRKLNNITTDEATDVTVDSNCTYPDSQLDDKDKADDKDDKDKDDKADEDGMKKKKGR